MKRISRFLPISDEMLADALRLQEYINERINDRLDLFLGLESATMETTADEMIRDIEDFLEGLT